MMSREIDCAEKIVKMKNEQSKIKIMKLLRRLLFFAFVLFLFAIYGWYQKIEDRTDETYSYIFVEENKEERAEGQEIINNVEKKLMNQ